MFNDDMNPRLFQVPQTVFPFFSQRSSQPQSWPRLLDLHKAWVLWSDVSASLSAPFWGIVAACNDTPFSEESKIWIYVGNPVSMDVDIDVFPRW